MMRPAYCRVKAVKSLDDLYQKDTPKEKRQKAKQKTCQKHTRCNHMGRSANCRRSYLSHGTAGASKTDSAAEHTARQEWQSAICPPRRQKY